MVTRSPSWAASSACADQRCGAACAGCPGCGRWRRRRLRRDLFDFGGGQVVDLDFGEDLEDGFESHHAFGGAFFFADARLAGNAQLGFVGGGVESLADLVVHDFVLHRVAVTLGDHAHGHLAGAETVHLDLTLHALEAAFDLFLDVLTGSSSVILRSSLSRVSTFTAMVFS
jgi:hypothetical protein